MKFMVRIQPSQPECCGTIARISGTIARINVLVHSHHGGMLSSS